MQRRLTYKSHFDSSYQQKCTNNHVSNRGWLFYDLRTMFSHIIQRSKTRPTPFVNSIYNLVIYSLSKHFGHLLCAGDTDTKLHHSVINSRTQPTNQLCCKQQQEAPARREKGVLNRLWKNKLTRPGLRGYRRGWRLGPGQIRSHACKEGM